MASRKPLFQLAMSSRRCPILELPNEIIQKIVCDLPKDQDIINFSQTCQEVLIKVFAPESAVWRDRFGKHYEIPPGKSSRELMMEYITRAMAIKADIDFSEDEDFRQELWEEVVRSMLQEAWTLPTTEESKTLECIRSILKNCNFLREHRKAGELCDLFFALHLCLTGFAIDPEVTRPCGRYDYDMQAVYSIERGTLRGGDPNDEEDFHASETSSQSGWGGNEEESEEESESTLDEEEIDEKREPNLDEVSDGPGTPSQTSSESLSEPPSEPLSEPPSEPESDPTGPESYVTHEFLDLEKFLHLRNFWMRHLLTAEEHTYHESFMGMFPRCSPKVSKNLTRKNPISVYWFGFHSCIHPFPASLEDLENRQSCADCETHLSGVDAMMLQVRPHSELIWPQACNDLAPLYEGPETKRFPFVGTQDVDGESEGPNWLFGFTEDIELAFGGFTGWKRICFTICEMIDGEPADLKEDSEGWVHLYEALMIPGGRIMLGRWTDLKAPGAKGPFIFWDV